MKYICPQFYYAVVRLQLTISVKGFACSAILVDKMDLRWGELTIEDFIKSSYTNIQLPLQHSRMNLVGSKLVLYGGELTSRSSREVPFFLFDIQSRSWSRLDPTSSDSENLPSLAFYTSVLAQDQILFFGGLDMKTRQCTELYVLDLILYTFEKAKSRGDPPPAMAGHASDYLATKKQMLVFASSQPEEARLVYSYTLWDRVWRKVKTTGNPPSQRSQQSSVVFGTKWFLYGGHTRNAEGRAELYILDTYLATAIWSKVNVLRAVPASGPAVRFHGKIVLCEKGNVQKLCCYDPRSNQIFKLSTAPRTLARAQDGSNQTYTIRGKGPTSTYGCTIVASQDQVFIFGGNSNSGEVHVLCRVDKD